MNGYLKKFKTISAAVVLSVFGNVPALAEDIEIYKKENLGSSSIKPNILFILDTSISMGAKIELKEDYLSTVDYSLRTGACFDNTRIYPVSDITQVTCTSSYTGNYFNMSQNQCAAATLRFANDGLLENTGFFIANQWSQWLDNKNIWVTPTNNNQDTYILECEQDQGIHGVGAGAGGAETYIATSGTVTHTTDATDADTNWSLIESVSLDMYSGNYMNYKITSSYVQVPKLDVMRNVITNLLFSVEGVNIGLMKFGGKYGIDDGGTVMTEVRDVALTRNDMYATMKTWDADTYTTLTESLYEAYRYYAGDTIYYGGNNTTGSATFVEGGTTYYKSPIDPATAACQRQFVIMLSDGNPYDDDDANGFVEALPGFKGVDGSPAKCDGEGMKLINYDDDIWASSSSYANGKCLDDLAKYMNEFGLDAFMGAGVTVEDVAITTYTVGFDISSDLLASAGTLGGGDYFEAYDSTGLLQTLISIINEIKGINTTFSSPAVSVNAFNRTTHRSDLYFTLFKPSEKANWNGNLKRFKLTFDSSGNPEIVDVNNSAAISNATGFFKDEAHSYWTPAADAPDGKDTRKGGAASKLSNTRNVFSNISVSSTLSDASNEVIETNTTNLTKTVLGIPLADDPTYQNLVKWIRGIDVKDDDNDSDFTDARRSMGDPLHGQPALIQYGGTDADPEIVAYVTTNEGYLHAIDTRIAEGSEIFSFIPAELLPNMDAIYRDVGTEKTYGLDGSVMSWVKDDNLDGIISGTDKVYIYFGMRRGGNRTVDVGGNAKKVGNYYGLDVTDRNNPVLMWKIEGGVNGSLGDFTELGQTWSKPIIRSIQLGGAEKKVLIFGAGYDTIQDAATVRTTDDIGRGIFIVDALTGERLWHAGPGNDADLILADMEYSVPSDVSAVDTTGDGFINHIYVGDMGGQLWRFDVDNLLGATTSVIDTIMSGGRIADLADSTADSNRKFFYAPDAAILQTSAGASYISLVITSGNRSKPTGLVVQDRAFMIRDIPVHGKPASYTTVTENNSVHELFDTTNNIIGQGSTQAAIDTATANLDASEGWFINFDISTGEKGLSKPLIFAGEAYFTTYEPADPTLVSASACTPNEGDGFLYHIFVSNGTPVRNYDTVVVNSDENLTKEDRVVTLARSGIPAEPRIIMPDGSNTAICVSTECDKLEQSQRHKTLYWYEK